MPTSIQSERERERERRRIRARTREQSDTVSSTPDRNVKCDEASGLPCKVPRFQYVDFPSLHQCIQQLSVPPLESWLSGCHMGMGIGRPAPGLTPASPKERAPKFKYADYPSLYHCIQQLSVPPLESWSATLPQPRGNDNSWARTVKGTLSQSVSTREDQATQTPSSNTSDSARVQVGQAAFRSSLSGDQVEERSSPKPNAPLKKQQLITTDPASHIPSSTGSKRGLLKGSLDQGPGLSMAADYNPGPAARSDPYRVSPKSTRPSVINLHPGKETALKRRLQGCTAGCPDSPQVASSAHLECVCTNCQKMFAGPEELRKHQENY